MQEPIQRGKGFLSPLPDTQIPNWFHRQNYGSSVSIPLPPDLSKNCSWGGIAVYTVIKVGKNLGNVCPGQESHNIHELIYRFDMQDGAYLENCTIFFHSPTDQSGVDLYSLCLYISHARFRDLLDRCSCISVSISTDSQSVRFETCGARILYEYDVVEFIHILSRKGCGIRKSPTYQYIENLKSSFLGDATEKLQDFDGNSVYNFCSFKSIGKLFTSISKDPLVTFDSPRNWYKDGTWMGLALYASFSTQSASIVHNKHLNLSLETDMGSLERFQTYCLTEEDIDCCRKNGLEWLCYMPRGSFPDWLDECSFIEASIATDHPGLTMRKCGFRLVFQHDVLFREMVQILDACLDKRLRKENSCCKRAAHPF